MEANANTIKTMGIISDEVYDKDYFNGKLTKIKGTTYKVLHSFRISRYGICILQLLESANGCLSHLSIGV